jgi:hypothetical protein
VVIPSSRTHINPACDSVILTICLEHQIIVRPFFEMTQAYAPKKDYWSTEVRDREVWPVFFALIKSRPMQLRPLLFLTSPTPSSRV